MRIWEEGIEPDLLLSCIMSGRCLSQLILQIASQREVVEVGVDNLRLIGLRPIRGLECLLFSNTSKSLRPHMANIVTLIWLVSITCDIDDAMFHVTTMSTLVLGCEDQEGKLRIRIKWEIVHRNIYINC